MNMLRMSALILFGLIFCSKALSYDVIGEVVNLRGEVTQLRPGDKLARKLSLNEQLLEDTSVLTGAKSMVVIKMRDRSSLTLGPESKMVLVEAEKGEDPGVVSLLNGRLRSEVQKKRKKKNHKQLISTRSAAMGVRGTDFIVSHNGKNNVTSLVTLQGEVEMAKIDESYIREVEKSVQEKRLERIQGLNKADERLEIREVKKARLKSRGRLKVALRSKQASKVGAGHHSGTVAEFNNVSSPVRIAPEQFVALYKNREFIEKSKQNETQSSEDFVLPKGLRYAPSKVSPLGLTDSDKKIYAPKAGGFVDLETGLYIPPDKNAAYHEDYDLFVSSEIGSIDSASGNYIPPAGLALDPIRGFVVNDNYASALNTGQRKLLAQNSEKLNHQLSSRLVVGDQESSKASSGQGLLSSRELMTKNILKASLQTYSQSMAYTSNNSDHDFKSSGISRVDLSLAHSSTRSWQLITGFSYKDVSYDIPLAQDNSGLFGLQLGARYHISSRLNFVSAFALEQDHYIELVENEQTLSSVNSTRLSFGVEWEAIRSSRWRLNMDAYLTRLFSKSTRELETQAAFGVEFKLYASYWLNRHNAFEFGPRFYLIDQDQKNAGVGSSLERDESGVVLSYKRVF